MKKSLLTWAVITILTIGLEAAVIRSKVVDIQGMGIGGVLITDGFGSVRSDSLGYFVFETRSNDLELHRLGFESLKLRAGQIGKSIIMQRREIELEPVVSRVEIGSPLMSDPTDLVSIRIDPDRHYSSAIELLQTETAFYSPDINLAGERKGLSLLGNLSRHTLVVVDGIVRNAQGEPFDFSTLELLEIERIEYVAGNASAYGGSAAIGGIVYIYSKRGLSRGGIEANISGDYGSYGYQKQSVALASSGARFSIRAAISEYETRNNFEYRDPDWWGTDSLRTRENNAKQQTAGRLSLAGGWGKVLFNYDWAYEGFRRELPGPTNFLAAYRRAYLAGESLRQNISLEHKYKYLNWNILAWMQADDTLYDNTRSDIPMLYTRNKQDLGLWGVRLGAGYEAAHTKLSVSGDWQATSIDFRDIWSGNQSFAKKTSRSSISARASRELDLKDLYLRGALTGRYDIASGDEHLSWRAELSADYYWLYETSAGASWGNSFALPSLYDLYWKGDAQALGNPELKSEESSGGQIWLENDFGKLQLKVLYHHNSITNLIQWRQVAMNGTSWKPVNIASAEIKSLKLELVANPLSWCSILGAAILSDARDVSGTYAEKPYLTYSPQTQYNLGIKLSSGGLGMSLDYNYIGSRYSTPDNLIDPLKPYDLVNMGLGYSRNLGAWKTSASIRLLNLLDRDYQVYAYVPQPGLNWSLSLKLSRSF